MELLSVRESVQHRDPSINSEANRPTLQPIPFSEELSAIGELIQMDTSIYDWLDWGKNIALISAIDEKTSDGAK